MKDNMQAILDKKYGFFRLFLWTVREGFFTYPLHFLLFIALDVINCLLAFGMTYYTTQFFSVVGEKDSYYFHFTNWDTRNGVNPQSEQMNTLLTTIEKVFLKIDPQTQVSTEDIKVKHRPKFF